MELQHEFTVPVPVDEAWRTLLDIERVAPCMPGATVESFDGETIKGAVKVKVGPVTVTYRGTAAFQEKDDAKYRMVLTANGKEVRGQGTARATVRGELAESAAGTSVSVFTTLTITGRPAQLGRGVLSEVGDKLIGQFADCLSEQLAGSGTTAENDERGTAGIQETEPLDLIRTAGVPVARRGAKVVAIAAAVAAVIAVFRRKRR